VGGLASGRRGRRLSGDARDRIDAALRAAWPAALAGLVRRVGALDRAEDFLQDATLVALARWPAEGIPSSPAAWLYTAARNRWLDALRHQRVVAEHAQIAAGDEASEAERDPETFGGDDLLRLVFTCCHPELPAAARLVLTLRAVAGLTVAEIAHALLIEERAAEQRLTRAKRSVRELGLPYEVPSAGELPERLGSALHVVYLVFNEGYKATSGEALIRFELCRIAIGLGRTLCRLFHAEPEVLGLLALMRLAHARSAARFTHSGEIVLLDRQDRSLWDRDAIVEGEALLEKAMRHRRPGPYQVQAAIAALHCEAESAAETDWRQIALLYRTLERLQPSSVVTVNRAVAVANAEGSERGLALLDGVAGRRELRGYPELHAARGALLERLGRGAEAAEAYGRARALTQHAPTAQHLDERIQAIAAGLSGSVLPVRP
jgi:RNA polymerase sigma-70 factor (ECF subfamily)